MRPKELRTVRNVSVKIEEIPRKLDSSAKIFELPKGAKRPQRNSNFMNKIEGRSNTEFSNLHL